MPADVATSLKDWSTTASSNSPSGSTAISNNLDDNLRQIQTVVRYLAASDTIASATTTDLGSKEATFLTVSGTTTITGLGTVSAGIYKWVVFSGALTLTHNGTSLILPTGANLTTAAGDTALFLSLGSGNWRCLSYTRATGLTIAGAQTFGDGTVGAPSITFTSDTDTGFYRIGANQFGAAANGANVATFGTTSVTIPTLSSTTATITTGNITTVNSNTVAATSTNNLKLRPGSDTIDLDSTNTDGYVKLARETSVFAYVGTSGSNSATFFCEPGSSDPYEFAVGTYNTNKGVHARVLLYAAAGADIRNDSGTNIGNTLTINANNTTTNAVYISTTAGGAIWRVSTAGATFADGSYSSSGADYSEAFLYTGVQPQPGDTVTLDGDKVRLATQGDEVIGVISEKPAFIGDQRLVDQGGVVVGLVGKLKVNPGCPVDSRWRLLDATNNIYLVR